MMNRRTLLLLAIALAALIQARLLPEVGLETLFNLPSSRSSCSARHADEAR